MPCLLRIQLSPCQHPHLLPKLQPWSGGIDNSSWGFFFFLGGRPPTVGEFPISLICL